MSSEWTDCTLGDFVRLQRGHDLTASEQKPGSVPVMGSAGPNGSHSEALASGPGVVIGRSGASIGRVHFSKVDYWPHNTCLYVTDFMGNNPRFAYYLLQTLNLGAYNSGSAQPSLNRNFIYTVSIQIPPRHEQDVIVEMLSALDDRITLLRETNTTLEAIVQAIFKSWFVDFDPVRAKMEGHGPEGMDEETAALFPDRFEELELGVVPKGWHIGVLNDIAAFQNGYAFKSKDWTDAGHPVVKIGDVKPGVIDFSGCSFVSAETVIGLERFRLERGNLLVGMTGYVGETGLVPLREPSPYLNQRVGRLTTQLGLRDMGYLYGSVRSTEFKQYAESQSHKLM